MSILDEILAQPGFSPAQLAVGAVMYLAWTAAYLHIIWVSHRDKSYGVPWSSLMLNVCWEFIFSFNLTDARLFWFFVWGNRLWLVFDLVILYQFFANGRAVQTIPWLQKWFYPVAVASLVLSGLWIYTFTIYFNDLKGVASSMTMNVAMGLMYIFMFVNRPDGRGMSYPAAWLKMIGTAAGSVFLYTWWPAQFQGGFLITHPTVPAPPTYGYMYFVYLANLAIDLTYIGMNLQRRRARRAAALTSAPGAT